MWRFNAPIVDRLCKVVFAGKHFHAALPFTRALLAERRLPVELVHAPTRLEIQDELITADVAVPFMEHFDQELLENVSKLRLIQQFGVGLEGVDLQTATRCGICVSNIPAANTGNAQATAEHAIFLTISLLRSATYHLPRRFQSGELGGLPIPRSLYRKNVTVIGYGSVGSKLCEYLICMGANVTAVRRTWNNSVLGNEKIVQSTSLDEALPTADVVILACNLHADTWHFINKKTLSLVRDGVLVVNVGRGPLVEYNAIRKALESGKVGGFASDVGVGHSTKPSEPWDCHDELCQLQNVIFTPHVGGYTDYSYGTMAKNVVDAITNVMNGKPPSVWVNAPN